MVKAQLANGLVFKKHLNTRHLPFEYQTQLICAFLLCSWQYLENWLTVVPVFKWHLSTKSEFECRTFHIMEHLTNRLKLII